MSRKSLIGEALAAKPNALPDAITSEKAPSPRPSFMTNRLDNFTEAARMVKKPTIRLKPSECSIWPGNARIASLMNYERNASLIESIKAENGNRIPVVVRKVKGGEKDYELIIGTRRHWAISWLNDNNFPDIELVAIIEELSDEAAFRLADIENRERLDVSDLERGENYKAAMEQYYDGSQRKMAERLGMSKSHLNRYIGLTHLPAVVINAFPSQLDIHASYADKLLPIIRSPYHLDKLTDAATKIAAEQSFRQSEGQELIPSKKVLAKLKAAAADTRAPKRSLDILFKDQTIGHVEKNSKDKLVLTINKSDLSLEDIIESLRLTISNSLIVKS